MYINTVKPWETGDHPVCATRTLRLHALHYHHPGTIYYAIPCVSAIKWHSPRQTSLCRTRHRQDLRPNVASRPNKPNAKPDYVSTLHR